jgi:Gpi18-like mannosyltransferase
MASQTWRQLQLWQIGKIPVLQTTLIFFLIVHIFAAVVAFSVTELVPPVHSRYDQPVYDIHNTVFRTQEPLRDWLEPWYRWDTGWYLLIAWQGYRLENGSIVFPPLYPFVIRLFTLFTGGNYLVSALIVSNLFYILALVLLHRLTTLDYGPQVARRTVLYLMSFPTAFFLLAGYIESLFLTLAIGAILGARQKRYLLAGLLGFLASLSRLQGWTLMFPLAYIIFAEPGDLRRIVKQPVILARRLFAATGSLAGTVAYMAAMQISGLGNASQALEVHWHIRMTMPWTTIADAARTIFSGSLQSVDLLSAGVFLFIIVIGVATIRRLRLSHSLYLWAPWG